MAVFAFACSVQCFFGTGGGFLTAAAQQELQGSCKSQCEFDFCWFGLYAFVRKRLSVFFIEAFCWSLGSQILYFALVWCILGLGHLYRFLVFCVCCDFHFGSMPYGKGNQGNKRNKEDTNREENLEYEAEITARDREDTLSPLSPASSSSAGSAGSDASGGSHHSGSSVSSAQLEMILAANSRSMEASILSIMSSITPSVSAGAVASTPAAASSPHIKVPKWTEGDQPFTFFTKLETALTHNKVARSTWGRLLPVYLSGRAEIAFAQVDSTLLDDYDAVKAVLLKALGDTPAHADRLWWNLARSSGETPADFYLRVRNTGLRRVCKLTTRDAVVDHVILSRFLSLLPAESYTAVMSQHPQTGLEAAELLQDFEETRAYSWKRQNWKNSGKREHSRGSSSSYGSGGNNHGSVGRSSSPNRSSSQSSSNNSNPSSSSGVEVAEPSSGDPSSGFSRGRGKRPIICHGCGEPGHIKPNCPYKIRRVKSPDSDAIYLVDGLINGSAVPGMYIDTGADRTLVCENLLSDWDYTGDTIVLDSFRGAQVSRHKVARVTLEVEGICVETKVVVVPSLDCPVLLGKDLGFRMVRKLMAVVTKHVDERDPEVNFEVPKQVLNNVNFEVPKQVLNNVISEVPMQIVHSEVTEQVVPATVVRVTRPQAKKAKEEEAANELASASSGSEPLALSEIYDVKDEFFDDFQVETKVASVTPSVVLGDIFGFEDALFEPEVVCEAPSVVLGDIFGFQDSLFEPEDACVAPTVLMDDIFSLSIFPFGPDLGEVEFFLPELEVLEASVAPVVSPACGDTFVMPKQLTDGGEEVFEVLEASVAPGCCNKVVVPMHLEDLKIEALEASVAPGFCDNFVVPMQPVVVMEVLAVDWIFPADTVCDNFSTPEEFFVEDQADVVASGPVDGNPMVGLNIFEFLNSVSETDPMVVPVPVARPDPESVVKLVILAMEVGISPKLCWQLPTVLVDHCLRCAGCISLPTGKFVPGSYAFILIFHVFTLVISSIFSFCACISICLSKFLVVLFFGAFGTRTVFCTPWGKLEHAAMSFVLRNGPAVMDLVLHQDSKRAVVCYLTETTRKSTPEFVAWSNVLEREVIYCSASCLIFPFVSDAFVLQTDHRALMFLSDAKRNNGRLARWALLLQQFTFSISYKKGCLNSNADILSRLFPEDPPSRMPDAPAAYEGNPAVFLPVSPTDEGGGDVMESLSHPAAAP